MLLSCGNGQFLGPVDNLEGAYLFSIMLRLRVRVGKLTATYSTYCTDASAAGAHKGMSLQLFPERERT